MSTYKKPFRTEKLIFENISESNFKTYIVDFDTEGYRYQELTDKLMDAIIEFSFGLIKGKTTENNEIVQRIRDAAKLIYSIEGYDVVRDYYVFEKEIPEVESKYNRRGEFGEIILHLLLREFHSTIPLLAKCYFKDNTKIPVHGFDGVHINLHEKSLWLGESKLYTDGKAGIKELIEDMRNHLKADYLREEFLLISNKLELIENIPERDYWIDLISKESKLEDIFESTTIPLLCTYSCDLFDKHGKNCDEFYNEIKEECLKLKEEFEKEKIAVHSNLNIILMLFPIPSKKELVKRMHNKLYHAQQV